MDILKTTTGYKYTPISKAYCQAIFKSPGICDFCGEIPESGNYIFVLNSYYCDTCLEEFQKVKYFPEDIPVENRNLERFVDRLNETQPQNY